MGSPSTSRSTFSRAPGRAVISTDPALIERFPFRGTLPRSVIVVTAERVYFQCPKALVRSELWNPDKRIDPGTLPTPGRILAEMSENRVGGDSYDREWPERARQSLW